MKVLIVNDVAAPVGGAEIYSLRIRDELKARGIDARSFSSSAYLDGIATPADYSCFGTSSRLRTLNRTINVDAFRELRGVLARFEPDVVHVRMFMSQLSPLIMSLLRDVPTVYHAATYELLCPTGHKVLPGGTVCRRPAGRACHGCLSPQAWAALMLQRRLVARWLGVFDVFVANSDTVRRRLAEQGLAPIVRVYNGVPLREPRPPLHDPPTVAYAGRLSGEKGVDLLVRAFARVVPEHPRARLLVVGDGPERCALEQLVRRLGLTSNTTLTGPLTSGDTEEVLAAAWAQVVPSRVEEPFGNIVAEAMMRGTAVVATDHGGPSEVVVDGETGLLTAVGDEVGLASALTALLADRRRAERLGEAGRRRCLQMLSIEGCVDQLVGAYRLAAGAARP